MKTNIYTRRGEPMCSPGYIHTATNKGRHTGLPLRWMTMMMAVLAFTACTNDDTLTAEQEITLTTPVIELSGVQASSRAQSMESVASNALVTLYLHDSEARKENRWGSYTYNSSSSTNWTADPSVTVTGGEGHYRAGIYANIYLKATTDMLDIFDAIYAYRGSVNVETDGTFTPDGTLQPYSAAVHLNLKDADGNVIDPMGTDATSNKQNSFVYLIKPVGLAKMTGFAGGTDGQNFPNGTADPVPNANTWKAYTPSNYYIARYTPGTYPATWEENRQLVTTEGTPTAPWSLFEVTYCKDGFEYKEVAPDTYDDVPFGPATTWTVSYPAAQLTLEAGKLYTFTATLGADACITLDAKDAVTITPWTDGSTITVGR